MSVNPTGCLFGTTATAFAVGVWRIIKFVGGIIGKLLYYFGLWAPFLYLIYGGILSWTLKLKMFGADVNGRLYTFGFALTLVLAVFLTVRNLFIKPYKKFFKRTDIVEYGKPQRLRPLSPEAPRIYKSKVNPGIIVYEYKNRFDLYEPDDEGGLTLVDTEYKKK